MGGGLENGGAGTPLRTMVLGQARTEGNHYLARTQLFRKTNISYPVIRTRTCAYQGLSNVSFSRNFTYVLKE